jgi:hypothetical protein
MPALLKAAVVWMSSMMLVPQLAARLHCPMCRALYAMCMLTRDEEQAVSTVMAGPLSPNMYATRPDATLCAVPVAE